MQSSVHTNGRSLIGSRNRHA